MLPITSLPPGLKKNPYLVWADRYLPYLCVAGVVLFLLLVPTKIWETNDDIAMAMISQGYGIAAYSSPGVIFSNVIWGWIVMHLPSVGGIESYTLATYCLLILAGTAIAFSMHRLGASAWMTGCILLLMLTHTLLIPQFTIVAGYLAVAGMVLTWAYKDAHSAWPLYIAALLLVLAGLIRSMELLFVVGVAWPFFVPASWRALGDRQFKRLAILALGVAAALCVAHVVDSRFYSSKDWAAFKQLNSVRVPYTDYRVGVYIAEHPELRQGSTLSMNDIRLLGFWFYQDPKVFDPQKIAALSAHVPWSARIQANREGYLGLLSNFRQEQFCKMFCLFPILLLVGFRRNTRALAGFTLLLCAMFTLYLLGRATETRIYIAPLSVILILLLATSTAGAPLRMRLLGMCGLGILVGLALYWGLDQRPNPMKGRVEQMLCSVAKDKPLVTWGAQGSPIMMLYRPGLHARPSCDPVLYSLGTMQLAPFELENLRRYTGTDLLAQALVTGHGIYMLTTDDRISLFTEYMRRHYSRALGVIQVFDQPQMKTFLLRDSGPAKPGGEERSAAPADSPDDSNGDDGPP